MHHQTLLASTGRPSLTALPHRPPSHAVQAAHVMASSIGWLYTYIRASNFSWGDHAKVVLNTPLGIGMPKWWPPLVEPLTPNHPLQSLAE